MLEVFEKQQGANSRMGKRESELLNGPYYKSFTVFIHGWYTIRDIKQAYKLFNILGSIRA